MRTIKFRGKRVDNGEWIEGSTWYRSQIEQDTEADRWVSVEERLPEKIQFVLLCEYTDNGFAGKIQTFHLGWYDNINKWFSESCGWMDNKNITHWQPLPQPPKERRSHEKVN